jgi:hypothetical protein
MATFIPGPTPLVTSTDAGLLPAPPSGAPTGKVFTDNLDWEEPSGGSATPAGTAGEVQINDGQDPAGLGAVTGFKWDSVEDKLDVPGDINLDDGGSFTTTLQLVTPTAARTITFPDATGTVGLVAGSTGQLTYNLNGAQQGLPTSSIDGSGNMTFSGRWIQSRDGAADAPPLALTGTWFTGGTATTTKPQFLIEPAGTTSTAWSTSGTGFGVNAASGFTGNLLDLQVNGTSVFNVPSIGGSVLGFTTANANTYLEIKGSTSARFASGVGNLITFVGSLSAHPFQLRSGNVTRLTIESAGGFTVADAQNFAVGTTTGTKIGTATTQKLGFYNATPVVQPAAVTDITTTATAGTLPTPDGTVTIADADVPTVDELLEYCVELEAKLEAALGHLRTLGLIAA